MWAISLEDSGIPSRIIINGASYEDYKAIVGQSEHFMSKRLGQILKVIYLREEPPRMSLVQIEGINESDTVINIIILLL